MQTYPAHVIDAIQTAWAWLATMIHPVAPYVCVLAALFLVQWAIRTWTPHLWQACAEIGPAGKAASKAFQALPSVALAALVFSLGTGGDTALIVTGAVSALFLPVGHETLKWASAKLSDLLPWLPRYYGGNWPAAGQAPIKLGQTATVRGDGSGTALPPLPDDGDGPRLPPAASVLLLVGLGLSQVCCSGSLVGAQRDALSARYGERSVEIGYAPSARCQELSDKHATWSAIAKGSAVLAGTSGVATLPADELPERVQGPARYTAAGVSVTSAALAAAAAVVAEDAAESFTRECLP